MKQIKLVILLILSIFSLTVFSGGKVTFAENIDPYDDDSQYAYCENIGWLNAEPLGDGGPGVNVEDTKLTGYIWGENIGWVSLSCENTGSCGTVNYGVTNDCSGNLAGYAWGENVGWISFSCENSGTCGTVDYGVTIDPATGEFNGYAWGENIGWITLRSTAPVPFGVTTSWISVPMDLPAGWSMISLPVVPESFILSAVFPGAVVLYCYEHGGGYVRVQSHEELKVGEGYWILLNEDRTYTLTGETIQEYTLSVENGWYIIGGCSSPAQRMVTNGSIDVIYGYTQGIGYERLDALEPLEEGRGYWILFSDTSQGAAFTATTSVSE